MAENFSVDCRAHVADDVGSHDREGREEGVAGQAEISSGTKHDCKQSGSSRNTFKPGASAEAGINTRACVYFGLSKE
jgi:hypothetical protein